MLSKFLCYFMSENSFLLFHYIYSLLSVLEPVTFSQEGLPFLVFRHQISHTQCDHHRECKSVLSPVIIIAFETYLEKFQQKLLDLMDTLHMVYITVIMSSIC